MVRLVYINTFNNIFIKIVRNFMFRIILKNPNKELELNYCFQQTQVDCYMFFDVDINWNGFTFEKLKPVIY